MGLMSDPLTVLFTSIMTGALHAGEALTPTAKAAHQREIESFAQRMMDAGADPANLVMQAACAGMGIAARAIRASGIDPATWAFETEALIILDGETRSD